MKVGRKKDKKEKKKKGAGTSTAPPLVNMHIWTKAACMMHVYRGKKVSNLRACIKEKNAAKIGVI